MQRQCQTLPLFPEEPVSPDRAAAIGAPEPPAPAAEDGTLETITGFYREALQEYYPRSRAQLNVRFYPYVGINHTIRVRSGDVFVRLAEVCREMSLEGHRALAYILAAKLYRKAVPKWAKQQYTAASGSAAIVDAAAKSRSERGRKVTTEARGRFFDLDAIFDTINARYFEGGQVRPQLSWSARQTYRMLGHHDAAHDTIIVSRSLDAPETPLFVIEYVMFHEMLHRKHPTIHRNGRRYNHTPQFRADERRFERYEDAERWIQANVRRLKRNAKRR